MNLRQVDHVGIAVRSLAEAARLFVDTLGGEFVFGGDYERARIRMIQVQLPGLKLELLEPLDEESPLHAHLGRHGEGFHHMTIFFDDVEAAVRTLEADGYEVVGTHLAHPGWREAYLRPSSGFGTLLQLVDTNERWDHPFPGITLEAVLAGEVVMHDHRPRLRSELR